MAVRSRRYVIVGDGAAGVTAARVLRGADSQAQITLISDDPNPAYFRAALTNYLLGELREEQIWATTPAFYDEYRLLRVRSRVVRLDPSRAELHLSQGGQAIGYDSLLVASGARARFPLFEGNHLYGVMVLRTLQDCRTVMEQIASGYVKQAVVIGGGPLALEWALGMHVRGIKVSVMLRGTAFMPGALDAVASDLLAARLRQAGIEIILQDEVTAATDGGNGAVASVRTRAGRELPCQLVAAAIGVVPNTEWLLGSGVQLGKRGGVVVDERMQTSVQNVFAAGDVSEFQGQALQLWEPAQAQASVAAANMSGSAARYAPGVHYMATRLFDLDFASLGSIDSAGSEELVDFPQGTGRISYRKLVLNQGKLVGALMLGQREDDVRRNGRLLKRLIDQQPDITSIKTEILQPGFDLRAWMDKNLLQRDAVQPVAQGVATAAQIRGTSVLDMSRAAELLAKPAASGAKPGSSDAKAGEPGFSAMGAQKGALGALGGSALVGEVGKDVKAATMALGTQVLTQFNEAPTADTQSAPIVPALQAPTARPAVIESAGARYELSGRLYRLGRDPKGEIVLTDPGASMIHAHIERHGSAWYLRDLGSQAGTWVNDKPLDVPRRLLTGDVIRIGQQQLSFYFTDEAAQRELATAKTAANEAMGPATPRFVVQSGHSLGLSFALTVNPTIVGRDPSCNIWLDELGLAPQHAKLRQVNGVWHLSTLGAPVWRNQQGLSTGNEVALTEGDVVHIGSVVLQYTQTPLPADEAQELFDRASQPHAGSAQAAQAAAAEAPRPPTAQRPTTAGNRAGQMQAFTADALKQSIAHDATTMQPSVPPPPQQVRSSDAHALKQAGAYDATTMQPSVPPPPPAAQTAPAARATPTPSVRPPAMQMQAVDPQAIQQAAAYDATGLQRVTPDPAAYAATSMQRATPAPPAFGRLRIHSGPGAGQSFSLAQFNVIGSQAGIQVTLPDPSVPLQALEVQTYQGAIYARALSAGVTRGGHALDQNAVVINSGEWFGLGPSTVVVFEADSAGATG